jgi:hypothetical protein
MRRLTSGELHQVYGGGLVDHILHHFKDHFFKDQHSKDRKDHSKDRKDHSKDHKDHSKDCW